MKRLIPAIAFIVLVVLVILYTVINGHFIFGILGVLQFEFVDPVVELSGTICTCIGPLLLLTFVVAWIAHRAGVNTSRLGAWTSLVAGSSLALLGLLDGLQRMWPYVSIASVFACLGAVGLIVFRKRKDESVAIAQESASGNKNNP